MFYDDYLINTWKYIPQQFLLLPDKKHSTTPSNLSESYAVNTVGSTSSNLEGILDNQLSFTNIMVVIWPFDEKSISSYNTKIFDAVVFTLKLRQTSIYFFIQKLKNIDGKRTLLSVDSETTLLSIDSETTRSFQSPKKTEDERKKRTNTMTKKK